MLIRDMLGIHPIVWALIIGTVVGAALGWLLVGAPS